MKNEYSLITGSTSGIGKSLAFLLGENHHNLILVARRSDELNRQKEELINKYNIDVICFCVDLRIEKNVIDFLEKIKNMDLFVNLLINNAGIGDYGEFASSNIDKNIDIINVNISSLVRLTHFFTNLMIEKRRGTVINIASTGAFVPGGLISTYYASKAFVKSFTEALYLELKPYNVNCLCVCPGPTKTNFLNNCCDGKLDLTHNIKSCDPDAVAKLIYKTYLKPKPLVIVGFKNKLAIFALRFLSYNASRKIIYKIQIKRTGNN